MTQVIPGYPTQTMGGLFSLAAQAAGVAAVADGIYAGANATITITNNSTKAFVIPAGGITIGSNQRIECCTFYKYTGATLNVAQANIASYQRMDAFSHSNLNIPEIILKPGERLAIRVYNRAPAAQANVTGTVHFFAQEERTFNQYNSNQKAQYNTYAGVN